MLQQPSIWLIAVAFVAMIGPLVFIHELGHYWVARWFGIGAQQFSIGFGREIFGWTDRRGTRWRVGWLPLGGYVRFVGDMNPASQAEADENLTADERIVAFHNKPWWQRFLVVLAGPMANFILAIIIIAGFLMAFGRPSTPAIAGDVQPGSSAAVAGLAKGDRLIRVDGNEPRSFEELRQIVAIRARQRVTIQYERGGRIATTTALIGLETRKDQFGQSYDVGLLGVAPPPQQFEWVGPVKAVADSTRAVVNLTGAIATVLKQIVVGDRSVKEIGGPLKMAQVAGQQASLGVFDFVQLMALISINLGFINLLPIPMLDGGHLVLYLAEAVRRRPVSPRVQDWAFRGGLAALLALLVVTTVNDLGSFGLFDRLGRLIG
jgi:regulator of sigma E protease